MEVVNIEIFKGCIIKLLSLLLIYGGHICDIEVVRVSKVYAPVRINYKGVFPKFSTTTLTLSA